jgi:two-component system, LytTR family, sensor kinase
VGYKKGFDKRFYVIALIAAIILPVIFLLGSYMAHEPMDWHEAVYGSVFTFLITITIARVNTGIVNYFNDRFPWEKGWAKRLGLELLFTALAAAIVISIVVTFLYSFANFHRQYTFWYALFQNAMIAIILDIIIITILEGGELSHLYRQKLLEAEILKRENIESQYSALINQINPHFMFNSLNVLSFLVSSNPAKAQEFISKFSWIYRYVLDVKDKSLVSLKDEMEFLNSYIFLQKLRYEDKLDFSLEIPDEPSELFLPPLSLQILVENAIKHNEISFQHPMMILIKASDGYLEVKNRIQVRTVKEESTGYGLKHLLARYTHFTDRKPFFGREGDDFVARIPLLYESE